MATDTAPARAKTVRPDEFIEAQLARAVRRIRLYDLAAGLLGFLAGTLVFVVLLAVCHRLWPLPLPLRWLALSAYAAAAGVYLALAVVRPLRRPINPAYAALQVERLLPGAKNSVVNYVELRDQGVSPVLRVALGVRAARDLARAEPEKAVSPRRVVWAGVLAGAAAAVFLVTLLTLGLARFLAPFFLIGERARVSLAVLRPEGGDAVVPAGQGLTVVVRADGPVPADGPDAPTLLFRYQAGDPDQARPLKGSGNEWSVALTSADVRTGFLYRVRAGGVETPQYRVRVRATPAVTRLRAHYRFPKYLGRAPEELTLLGERKIEVIRGTEVTLTAETNRDVKGGRLDLEGAGGKKAVAAERGTDARTLTVRFTPEEGGFYRLRFVSTEDETYADPVPYPLVVLVDQAPVVELTRPAEADVVAADGWLHLEGRAVDDFGVRSLTLKMRIVGGPDLRERPYRPVDGSDDPFALPDGGHLRTVEYRDAVDCTQLRDAKGAVFTPAEGMVLECWLEAADACDQPRPNVGVSKRHKVTFLPPEKDAAKHEAERKQAEEERKRQEAKQEEQKKREEQERKAEAQRKKEEREAAERAANGEGQGEQENKGGKEGDANRQQQEKDRGTAESLQKAIDRNRQQQGGEGKGDNKAGENKGQQGQEGTGKEGAGENKSGDKQRQQNGESKGGQQGGMEQSSGGKDGGKPDPGMTRQGEGKPGEQGGQQGGQAGESKGDGTARPENAESKDGGGQARTQQSADAKGGGPGQPGGESKGGETAGGAAGNGARAESKPRPEQTERGESKGAADGARGEGKKGDTTGAGGQAARAENKPAPPEAQPGSGDSRAENKTGGPRPSVPPPDAGVADVKRLLKEAQGDDPARSARARNDLERIANEANEQQARDAAGEALNELAQGDAPGAAKPGGQGDPAGTGQGDGKAGGGGEQPGKNGEGKNGEGAGTGPGGEGKAGAGGGAQPGASKGVPEGTPLGQANGGPEGRHQRPVEKGPARAWRPSMAQLDDFRNLVNPDVLKEAGLSPEEYRQFLARYQKAAEDAPRRPLGNGSEDLPGSRTARLPSDAGRRDPGPATTDEMRGADKPKAPPFYRKAYDELSRKTINDD
jgi:hypothetical protein